MKWAKGGWHSGGRKAPVVGSRRRRRRLRGLPRDAGVPRDESGALRLVGHAADCGHRRRPGPHRHGRALQQLQGEVQPGGAQAAGGQRDVDVHGGGVWLQVQLAQLDLRKTDSHGPSEVDTAWVDSKASVGNDEYLWQAR